METAVTLEDQSDVEMVNETKDQSSEETSSSDRDPPTAAAAQPRRCPLGRRSLRGKRRSRQEKRAGQKQKRRGHEEKVEGVTVKRTLSGGRRRWDKKHYCVFCRRPQVKIARHLLRKHGDEQEVMAASTLPTGCKQRHLLLEHLRCRGNYLHNIEVIRQGSGEIVPWRQPSEDVDPRNYLPCPLCLGFFLRADLWKHQVSCRKKLATDSSRGPAPRGPVSLAEVPSDLVKTTTSDTGEETPTGPFGQSTNQRSESGHKQTLTSDSGMDQNQNLDSTPNQPKKRTRVQAVASRLLPISSGASESCSEVLHRMNQDNVSYEVKSDWLICKYGNKLMGNQDGGQRRYDYFSQKLRELGRLLLAAKSLDPDVQTLQDLLAPGRLSLVLSAARKAAGYRWSRPPLSVKTTLRTVCEIAIGESLQDADWEAAAKTTDFYQMLGREWDSLVLQNPGPDTEAPEEETKPKNRVVQSTEQRSEVLFKSSKNPEVSMNPPESRVQTSVPVPVPPRKTRRRPWSSEEKEAIWRQLGGHVLVQSVPGKEVCQRCLDLEPVLRGRHWKDIKNQVHNQIQSQKKQQFHSQMDLEENQHLQTQNQKTQHLQSYQLQRNQQDQEPSEEQEKLPYQAHMEDPDQDRSQDQKRPQYQIQMNHQIQDSLHNQKKQLQHLHLDHQDHLHNPKKQVCNLRLDHLDHSQVHKKQLHQMDQQNQLLQSLDRDSSIETVYGADGPLPSPGHPLLDQETTIPPYPALHRPQMDPLLTRTDWTNETLVQNYPVSRSLGQNFLQEIPPGGPSPDPHSGHVHF